MSCGCNNQNSSCGCGCNQKPVTPCVRRQLAEANKAILAAADILYDYIEEYDLDDEDDCSNNNGNAGCGCGCGCNSRPSCGVTHQCCHKVPRNNCGSSCGQRSCGCWGRS